jgi:hypothetical protein
MGEIRHEFHEFSRIFFRNTNTRTTHLIEGEEYPPSLRELRRGWRGGGNKGKGWDSYVMNSLSRRARHGIERGVVMASVVHSMTRLRTIYPNRNLFRRAWRRKNFLGRRLVLLCARSQSDSRRGRIRTRSRCKLAIRSGRFPSARAARATARRIGISVWRSDYWEIAVVAR